jgi:hypothetical protein
VSPAALKAPATAPSASHGAGTGRGALVVRAPRSIKRAALLRRGVKVTVTAARAGRATATLQFGRHAIARGSRRLAAERTAVLTLKPSRRQAPRVRHAPALKLRVRTGGHVYAQRLALRR